MRSAAIAITFAIATTLGFSSLTVRADGITWTSQTSAADNDWRSLVWGGPTGQEKFVAVGASGTGNRVMTSGAIGSPAPTQAPNNTHAPSNTQAPTTTAAPTNSAAASNNASTTTTTPKARATTTSDNSSTLPVTGSQPGKVIFFASCALLLGHTITTRRRTQSI